MLLNKFMKLSSSILTSNCYNSSSKSFSVHRTWQHHSFSSLVSQKVSVNSVDIAYTKCGSGDNVTLLLPGALGSGKSDFKEQLSGLEGSKLTLVAWDPPGYGDSRPPDRNYGHDFLHRDADMAADMMKTLGYNKYSALGWSDGGITGLILAAKNTSAVKNLMVWGANAYVGQKDADIYRSIRDINLWSARMREPMEKIYGPEVFKHLWEGWVDTLLSIYDNKDGDLCRELLKNISCPTLIIHGNKDAVVPEEHCYYLRDNVKNSILEIFEEGKHNLHMKYSKEFNERAEKFILTGK